LKWNKKEKKNINKYFLQKKKIKKKKKLIFFFFFFFFFFEPNFFSATCSNYPILIHALNPRVMTYSWTITISLLIITPAHILSPYLLHFDLCSKSNVVIEISNLQFFCPLFGALFDPPSSWSPYNMYNLPNRTYSIRLYRLISLFNPRFFHFCHFSPFFLFLFKFD